MPRGSNESKCISHELPELENGQPGEMSQSQVSPINSKNYDCLPFGINRKEEIPHASYYYWVDYMAGRRKTLFLAGRWWAIAVLISAALFSCSSADILIKGEQNYNYDYNITNIKDYPNYVFLTSSGIWNWKYTSVINSSTGLFGGGYKLDHFLLHAIAASDFDQNLFFSHRDEHSNETSTAQSTARTTPRWSPPI
jgi:hypothetical protein